VRATDDFGHLIHRTPREVVLPASAGEAAEAILRAPPAGLAARGRGRPVWGRSQVRDGIVAATERLAESRRGPRRHDHRGGGGDVGGGAGRDPAAPPRAAQLEVVAGTGERIVCAGDREPGPFDAVRAGLGQVAVITRATLALAPAHTTIRRYTLSYPDLATLLADQRALAREERFDAVRAVIAPGPDGWAFVLDAAAADAGPADDARLLAGLADDRGAAEVATSPFLEDTGRLARLEQALRADGRCGNPHSWLTTFVGDAAIAEVAGTSSRG
jgi:cytokinin dehydrogenase